MRKLLWLLCLFMILIAPAATITTTALAVSKVVITTTRLGSKAIPCLVACLPAAKKMPVVFIHHGYGGRKENHSQRALDLAKRGYLVIVPDAGWHGERVNNSAPQPSMIRIIMDSAREDIDIVNCLKTDKRADTSRVGIAGFSMGALAAFVVPTLDKRFVACAPWCGNPDWSGYNGWGGSGAQKLIEAYSPLTHANLFYPCAILSQHGELDSGMPAYMAEELMKLLRKTDYKKTPERLKVVEHEGLGHDVNLAMEKLTWEWFDKFLKP